MVFLGASALSSLHAAPPVVIRDWKIEGRTLSFRITGELRGAEPFTNGGIFWISPDPATQIIGPSGFGGLTDISNTLSILERPFFGTATLGSHHSPTIQDAIIINWGFSPLEVGETYLGSYEGNFFSLFTANQWAAQDQLKVYWGRAQTGNVASGTFQSNVFYAVPEPSVAVLALIGLGALCAMPRALSRIRRGGV